MKCINADADRKYQLKVIMLDNSEMDYEITDETCTQNLLDLIFKQLDLNENIFFGLYFYSNKRKKWLINNKKIVRQVSLNNFSKTIGHVYFGVKFYIDNPCKLNDETTRYQFFLQIKNDIMNGKLEVSFELSSQLFAYALQSELGDFDRELHQDNYASQYKFQLKQSKNLEEKAEELHKGLIGKMPASVEMSFLDCVKNLELYGTELFSVFTDDDEENFLGLSPTGVLVLHQNSLFAHYYWNNIVGVYKKGRYFMIKVFDKENEKTTYGFELRNKKNCKTLWKYCIEYQIFHKLIQSYYQNEKKIHDNQSTRLDEITERFRSINLNELIVRRRKSMFNIFQTVKQHVNSLNNKNSSKDSLKNSQLTGINFTVDFPVINDSDFENSKKLKKNKQEKQAESKKELNSPEKEKLQTMPDGFYIVNNKKNIKKSENDLFSKQYIHSNDNLLMKKSIENFITTPGYNEESNSFVKNHKCDSILSLRSHRSRAAYSEVAFSNHNRHHHKKHRHSNRHNSHCSNRSNKSFRYHKHHHGHEDFDDLNIFDNSFKKHENKSRSHHTLENDKLNSLNQDSYDNNFCCLQSSKRQHSRHKKIKKCMHNYYCPLESNNFTVLESENDFESSEDEKYLCKKNYLKNNKNSFCCSNRSLNKSLACKYKNYDCQKKNDNCFCQSKISLHNKTDLSDFRLNKYSSKRMKKNKLIDIDDSCTDYDDSDTDVSFCSYNSKRYRHLKENKNYDSKFSKYHKDLNRLKFRKSESVSELNKNSHKKCHKCHQTIQKKKQNFNDAEICNEVLNKKEEFIDNTNKVTNLSSRDKLIDKKNEKEFKNQNSKAIIKKAIIENNFLSEQASKKSLLETKNNLLDENFLTKNNFNTFSLDENQINFNQNYSLQNFRQETLKIEKSLNLNKMNLNKKYQGDNSTKIQGQNLKPNLNNYCMTNSSNFDKVSSENQFNKQKNNILINESNFIGLPAINQNQNFLNQSKSNIAFNSFSNQNFLMPQDESIKDKQLYQNLKQCSNQHRLIENKLQDVPQPPPRNMTYIPPPLPAKPSQFCTIKKKDLITLDSSETISNAPKLKNHNSNLNEDVSEYILYAKPNKQNLKEKSLNANKDNKNKDPLIDDLNYSHKIVQNNISSESANGSITNLNTLDSGISVCSSSTNDFNFNNKLVREKNFQTKLNSKVNVSKVEKFNEIELDSTLSKNLLNENKKLNDVDLKQKTTEKSYLTQIIPNKTGTNLSKLSQSNIISNNEIFFIEVSKNNFNNQITYNQNKINNQINGQNSTQQTNVPSSLHFYEINTEIDSKNKLNRNVNVGEFQPIIPKLKCYEISTEL